MSVSHEDTPPPRRHGCSPLLGKAVRDRRPHPSRPRVSTRLRCGIAGLRLSGGVSVSHEDTPPPRRHGCSPLLGKALCDRPPYSPPPPRVGALALRDRGLRL